MATPSKAMKAWQQKLINVVLAEGKPNPLPKYGADGLGGTETQDALLQFQEDHGLQTTGQFDAETRLKLSPSKPQGKPMPNILGSLFSGLLGNLLNWQLIQGYVRNALLLVAGWIGLDGLVGADGSKIIVGSLLAIIGVIVSAVSNNTKVKAMAVVAAVDAHSDIKVTPAAKTLTGKPLVTVAKNG